MSGPSNYNPQNPVLKWVERRLPIGGLIHSSFVAYPTPRNLNYWWTFGAILSMMLGVQIITGIILAMHYVPHVAHAFDSVERIRRDVRGYAVRRSTRQRALRHVSSDANSSSGGAIDIAGKSSIAVTTSSADTGSIDTSGSVELAASMMISKCTGSVSDSGNNFVRQSIGCPGESTTTDRLSLAFGDYGGLYAVVGIAQATSVLRDLLAPIAGEPDVRG